MVLPVGDGHVRAVQIAQRLQYMAFQPEHRLQACIGGAGAVHQLRTLRSQRQQVAASKLPAMACAASSPML